MMMVTVGMRLILARDTIFTDVENNSTNDSTSVTNKGGITLFVEIKKSTKKIYYIYR